MWFSIVSMNVSTPVSPSLRASHSATFVGALLALSIMFVGNVVSAQEAPPPPPAADEGEDYGGAPDDFDEYDDGKGDLGATTDYRETEKKDETEKDNTPEKKPPASGVDPSDEEGDWGGEGDAATAEPKASGGSTTTTLPKQKTGGAYAEEPEEAVEAEEALDLAPVEGLDDLVTFAAGAGGAAAMNLGVGGVLVVASTSLALVSAASPTFGASTASTSLSALVGLTSCAWGCFAAPAATGFLVAYLGDMLGKKRGGFLFPMLASFGSLFIIAPPVLLIGAIVPLAATGRLATTVGRIPPPPSISDVLILQASGALAGAIVGAAMSAVAAGTYFILAEDRRPGDPGGGIPGAVDPAHSQPVRLSQGQLPASTTVAMRY